MSQYDQFRSAIREANQTMAAADSVARTFAQGFNVEVEEAQARALSVQRQYWQVEGGRVNTDMLNEARRDITDVIEEVGAVCTHLREAMDFAECGNKESAVASVDDAQDAIDTAIRELLKIRDKAGRWSVWVEGGSA